MYQEFALPSHGPDRRIARRSRHHMWIARLRLQSPIAERIMKALAYYADDIGECWPSQETIAKRARCSVATVKRHLGLLEEAGHLARERRHRGSGRRCSNIYRFLIEPTTIAYPVHDEPTAIMVHEPDCDADDPPTDAPVTIAQNELRSNNRSSLATKKGFLSPTLNDSEVDRSQKDGYARGEGWPPPPWPDDPPPSDQDDKPATPAWWMAPEDADRLTGDGPALERPRRLWQ